MVPDFKTLREKAEAVRKAEQAVAASRLNHDPIGVEMVHLGALQRARADLAAACTSDVILALLDRLEKATKPKYPSKALRDACKLVEEFARCIGPDCEVVFCTDDKSGSNTGVQVACLSWGGACSEPTLYKALQQAWKERD